MIHGKRIEEISLVTSRAEGILALYSLDARLRDAVLASRFQDARLASLLRRDATVALLLDASGQRRLRESGLLGPAPKGACLLYSPRRAGFALASRE